MINKLTYAKTDRKDAESMLEITNTEMKSIEFKGREASDNGLWNCIY